MSRRLTPGWRIRATAAACLLPPLVHLASLERIAGLVRRAAGAPEPSPDVDPASLAEWVDRVLRRLPWPWHATCLKRALVLYYLVARAGVPATLVIGVRRGASGELLAHAWLDRGGALYLEPAGDASSYRRIAEFSGPEPGVTA